MCPVILAVIQPIESIYSNSSIIINTLPQFHQIKGHSVGWLANMKKTNIYIMLDIEYCKSKNQS